MGSPAAGWAASLAATLAAGLAALLAEGLARGLAAFGSRLGRGRDRGLQPLWQAVLASSLLSNRLGAKRAEVGRGVVGIWTMDSCAKGGTIMRHHSARALICNGP
jgi:hypothetical protein